MGSARERSSVPQGVGRYEIVGQLATGGMAEILLGRLSGPERFERPVVVKRILPHLAKDRRFAEMLIDEARIVARIVHPNVVSVLELGRDDGELYMVMEYLEGESLGGLMRRLLARGEALDVALACHLIAETAAGLHAAHELVDAAGNPEQLVHRDVTPQNVFITYAGEVKLIDFGIAKAVDRSTRTETGMVKGKFAYMSPEQCLGKPLDRRSDVFALGILLYELTTSRRLFKQANELLTFRAICELPITRPSLLVPGYARELEAIVLRALERPLDRRTATAAELRRELLRIVHGLGEHEPKERLAELMRRLFPDRIAEKQEMLRRFRAGAELDAVPAAEVDENVDLPVATEFGSAVHAAAPTGARRGRAVPLTLGVLLLGGLGWAASRELLPRPKLLERATLSVRARAADVERPRVAALVEIGIESTPPGAEILLDGTRRGVTPLELDLPKGKLTQRLELRRDGYRSVVRPIVADRSQKLVLALEAAPAPRAREPARPKKPAEGFERFD